MKIIGSDYDGTLSQGGVSERVKDAIKRWRDKGNKFGVVTGRGMDSFEYVSSSNGIELDFYIANNGAVISDGNGNIIFEEKCPQNVIKPLLEIMTENDRKASIIKEYTLRSVKREPDEERISIDEAAEFEYFNQISTVCQTFEESLEYSKRINEKFGDIIIAYPNGRCIDVVKKGISKASGIYEYIKMIGASEKDVRSAGDNINDLAMIEAFESYAVGNAIDVIVNAADHKVSDIYELIENEL